MSDLSSQAPAPPAAPLAPSPWPTRLSAPVSWSDMDAFGHVNNTMYLKWFENARIAWFEACGVMAEMSVPGKAGIGPILASTSCRFLRPVAYPDRIVAEARTVRIGRSSFTMAYRVHSETLNTLVAEGEGVVVMVDYGTGQSAPISEALRGRMRHLDVE